MRKLLFLIALSAVLFFSCNKTDKTEGFTQLPQFEEFIASSSADNGKFFTSRIEIKKGESVTITYEVVDAETLDLYYNGQCFMSKSVPRFIRAGYMYLEDQTQNSFVFKLVATNPLGSTSREIAVVVH